MLASLEPFFIIAESMFEFLALNSIYSAFLAFALLVVKLFIPKLPRAIEYGLWCLVLIRLVIPTDFSVIYSLGYLGNVWFDTQLPIVIKNNDWLSQWATQKLYDDAESSLTWFHLLLTLWAVISSLVAFKFIRLKIKLSKLLAIAHPVEQDWLAKIVNTWRREFEVRRTIIIIDSDDFLSPFTFGVFFPVIFIPEQLLAEKKLELLEPIIAHEMAHIKRLDALWLVFQNLLQVIYCLNPVLWLAVGRLNSLREEICDQKVLTTNNLSSNVYGKSLLQVLRLNIGEVTPEHFATFFLSHKQMFKKRIEAIGLNTKNDTNRLVQTAIMLCTAFFFLPLGWEKVIEIRELKEFIPPPAHMLSPFPDAVRKEYRPPFLLNKSQTPIKINKNDWIEIQPS
ncbi:MAG: M56 family metallopeptidase [Kangiellaceae bacterium]|nr:M56 family metallopeptidase [Kangiellaceae bacterium]